MESPKLFNEIDLTKGYAKVRISKASLAKLPKPVASAISELQADFSYHGKPYFSSMTLCQEPANSKAWMGEGETIRFINSQGQSLQFENVSGDTLGASNVAHNIGDTPGTIPEGSYMLKVGYYAGYHLTVTYYGPVALPAGR